MRTLIVKDEKCMNRIIIKKLKFEDYNTNS